MASSRKTVYADTLFVKQIIPRDILNNKITKDYILVADSNSEAQWINSAELFYSSGFTYLSTSFSTLASVLSNYVFTPMKYSEDNNVSFTNNLTVGGNLTVDGTASFGNTANFSNDLKLVDVNSILSNAGKLENKGSVTLNDGIIFKNKLPEYTFNTILGLNTKNNLIFTIPDKRQDDKENNQVVFSTSNATDTPTTNMTIDNTYVKCYQNLDVLGNLSFNSISTGSLQLHWLSTGNAAFDVGYAKVFSASTFSVGIMIADTLSVSQFYASNINFTPNLFSFNNISTKTLASGTISTTSLFSKDISTGTLYADVISVGKLNVEEFTVSSLYVNSISAGSFYINYVSAGVVEADTISTVNLLISNLSVATLYSEMTVIDNEYVSTLTANAITTSSITSAFISTGYLDTPFISTLYGEFGFISSSVYTGPLTSTAVVEVSSLYSLRQESSSSFINYLSAGNAVFSTLVVPTLFASEMSTGTSFTGLGNFSSLSTFNLYTNTAIIDNLYAKLVLSQPNYDKFGINLLILSSLSTLLIQVPNIQASTIETGILSSGLILGGILQTSSILVEDANITNLSVANGDFTNMNATTYTGTTVSTPYIYASNISSIFIYTDKLQVTTYTLNDILANTVSTGNLFAKNVSTGYLTVGTISTGYMVGTVSGDRLQFNNITLTSNIRTAIANFDTLNTKNGEFTNHLIVKDLSTTNLIATGRIIGNNTILTNEFEIVKISSLSAIHGSFKSVMFEDIDLKDADIEIATIKTLNSLTSRISQISTGSITSGTGQYSILNASSFFTSTMTANIFNTGEFNAENVRGGKIFTNTFNLSTLSAVNVYTTLLSTHIEYVGTSYINSLNMTNALVTNSLGIGTYSTVTNLDVNGSVNIGRAWRFFLGLGDASVRDSSIKVSSDGLTWKNTTNSFTFKAKTAYWTGKIWIAGGDSLGTDPSLKYSYDGLIWIDCIITNGNNTHLTEVRVITKIKNFFIAGGISNNYGSILTSLDGITWKYPTNNIGTTTVNTITSNTIYMIVGLNKDDTNNSNKTIYYGTLNPAFNNNITNNNINLLASDNVYKYTTNNIIWTGKLFIAIGNYDNTYTNTIINSQNGINWEPVIGDYKEDKPDIENNDIGNCLAYNGNIILAGASITPTFGSNSIKYSYDGLSWANATGYRGTNTTSITWNGTFWIACTNTGYTYSDNGIVWNQRQVTNAFQRPIVTVWSGDSNFPVSTLINGSLETLLLNVNTDVTIGSNLLYTRQFRNISTQWAIPNNILSNIENNSFTNITDNTLSALYLKTPTFYNDSFENIIYSGVEITVSSLIGSNIISTGQYVSSFFMNSGAVSRMKWLPIPANPVWLLS